MIMAETIQNMDTSNNIIITEKIYKEIIHLMSFLKNTDEELEKLFAIERKDMIDILNTISQIISNSTNKNDLDNIKDKFSNYLQTNNEVKEREEYILEYRSVKKKIIVDIINKLVCELK